MNMEDGIMFGVMAVVGIVAVAVVLGLTNSITELTRVTNETITVTAPSNGTTRTLAHQPLDGTALVIKNGTGAVTLSSPQNYTYVASTGVITFNSSAWGNISTDSLNWRATYQYQPTGYVTGSNATLVNNYSVLMLLGVLAFVGFFVARGFGVFK